MIEERLRETLDTHVSEVEPPRLDLPDLMGRARRRRSVRRAGLGAALATVVVAGVITLDSPGSSPSGEAPVVDQGVDDAELVLHSVVVEYLWWRGEKVNVDKQVVDSVGDRSRNVADWSGTDCDSEEISIDDTYYTRGVGPGCSVKDREWRQEKITWNRELTPYSEASAELIRALIDGGTVEEAGQDGEVTRYRIVPDEGAQAAIRALPPEVVEWFGLIYMNVDQEPEKLGELVIGVDDSTGLVAYVKIAVDGLKLKELGHLDNDDTGATESQPWGYVSEQTISIPDEPAVIEPPI